MLLAVLPGCESDDAIPPDAGARYFPIGRGVYQIYTVEEVHYAGAASPLKLTYELLTEVVDSFPSAGGTYTYVIHRSKRVMNSEDWQLLDTWSVRRDGNSIILSEGNTAYVKLRFPLKEGNTWNGNAFNSLGEDQYTLRHVRQPFQANDFSFSSTVTVEQEFNEDRIVFRDERKEVYAEDVGLVYREIVQLDYCTDDACLGQQKVDEGIEMKMTIIGYGKK